jgi:hypothetical protein
MDIVPNNPPRYDPEKYSVLQLDSSYLSDGDRLSILYDLPYDGKKSCIVANTVEKVKDFDLRVSFKLKQENIKTNLFRAPDNEIFIMFRGSRSNLDATSDYDDFYKFSVNTDRATFSLSKVILSESVNDYLTQHISLSFNNDEVFEPVIIYPETSKLSPNEVFVFDREGYSKTAFSLKDTLEAFGFKGTWKFFKKHWRFGLDEYRGAFSKTYFLNRLRKLIPDLQMDDIVPADRCGIRAMALSGEGNMLDDFKIEYQGNSMHVINSPSPAATASLAYGNEIAMQAMEYFKL